MGIMIFPLVIIVLIALELLVLPTLVYFRRKKHPDITKLPSPWVFVNGILLAAVAGYIFGLPVGIPIACSFENAGNLCGLAGMFMIPPLFSLLAALGAPVIVYVIGRHQSGTDQ